MKRLVSASVAVLALSLAACKTDATGGMVNAAASGDAGAMKSAAGEAAKGEATAQVESQVPQAGQAQEAVAQAKGSLTKMTPTANYPLKTCVVTGEPLPATPVAYSWQGREVQFCCAGCAADFLKDPATYLAKLDAAR